MKLSRLCMLCCGFCCLLLQGACTHVEPWERGALAKPQMSLDGALQDSMRKHTYSSREAAASTNAAGGGGGCGCY